MYSANRQNSVSQRENKYSPFLSFLKKALKFLIGACILALLSGICFLFIYSYYERISEQGNITRGIIKDDEAKERLSYAVWRLRSNRPNNIIKDFYNSISDIESVSNSRDMLSKGIISFEKGKPEEFYCITSSDKTLLKIGSGMQERAYLIGDFNEGVQQLYEGRISGSKAQLDEKAATVLRAIVYFDDVLAARAFTSKFKSERNYNDSFAYEGISTANGSKCDVVGLMESGNCNMQFHFDQNTHRLSSINYKTPLVSATSSFDEYYDVDNSYKAPKIRNISVNGKHYATVRIDFIVRNRGLILPQ